MKLKGSTKLFLERCTSFILIICFLTTSVVWSAPPVESQLSPIARDLKKISVPETLGRIDEIYLPESMDSESRLVIFIQDAHANLAAQKNISEIANILGKQFKIEAILKEGGTGEADLTALRAFPDQVIKDSVTNFWMKEAVLSGIERQAIIGNKSYRFFGIEEKELYEQGSKYFVEVYDHAKSLWPSLNSLHTQNKENQKNVFNPNLFRFEELVDKFESKRELIPLVELIANEARNLHINRWKYLEIEKFIDLILAEMNGEQSERIFEIQRSLDSKKLFSEIELLKAEIKEALFENKKERLLDREAQFLKVLKSMISLEATPQDVTYFEQNQKSIQKYLSKKKLDSKAIQSAKMFYESARKRDHVLFSNVRDILQKQNLKRAFLVAGGFHTQNITEQFRKHNISYAVITPGVSDENNFEAYVSRISGNRASLDYFKSHFSPVSSTHAAPTPVLNPQEVRTILDSFQWVRVREEKSQERPALDSSRETLLVKLGIAIRTAPSTLVSLFSTLPNLSSTIANRFGIGATTSATTWNSLRRLSISVPTSVTVNILIWFLLAGPSLPIANLLRSVRREGGQILDSPSRSVNRKSQVSLRRAEVRVPTKNVQDRRDILVRIVDSLDPLIESSIDRKELTKRLNQVPGYEHISESAVARDTDEDTRLANDPRLRVNRQTPYSMEDVDRRRDVEYEILKKLPKDKKVTPKKLASLLRQKPGYENVTDAVVRADLQRDPRLKDTGKIKGRRQSSLVAATMPEDALSQEQKILLEQFERHLKEWIEVGKRMLAQIQSILQQRTSSSTIATQKPVEEPTSHAEVRGIISGNVAIGDDARNIDLQNKTQAPPRKWLKARKEHPRTLVFPPHSFAGKIIQPAIKSINTNRQPSKRKFEEGENSPAATTMTFAKSINDLLTSSNFLGVNRFTELLLAGNVAAGNRITSQVWDNVNPKMIKSQQPSRAEARITVQSWQNFEDRINAFGQLLSGPETIDEIQYPIDPTDPTKTEVMPYEGSDQDHVGTYIRSKLEGNIAAKPPFDVVMQEVNGKNRLVILLSRAETQSSTEELINQLHSDSIKALKFFKEFKRLNVIKIPFIYHTVNESQNLLSLEDALSFVEADPRHAVLFRFGGRYPYLPKRLSKLDHPNKLRVIRTRAFWDSSSIQDVNSIYLEKLGPSELGKPSRAGYRQVAQEVHQFVETAPRLLKVIERNIISPKEVKKAPVDPFAGLLGGPTEAFEIQFSLIEGDIFTGDLDEAKSKLDLLIAHLRSLVSQLPAKREYFRKDLLKLLGRAQNLKKNLSDPNSKTITRIRSHFGQHWVPGPRDWIPANDSHIKKLKKLLRSRYARIKPSEDPFDIGVLGMHSIKRKKSRFSVSMHAKLQDSSPWNFFVDVELSLDENHQEILFLGTPLALVNVRTGERIIQKIILHPIAGGLIYQGAYFYNVPAGETYRLELLTDDQAAPFRAETRAVYRDLNEDRKSLGERMEIPESGFRIKRSWSPEMIASTFPVTAHSRTALSLGSRQTWMAVWGLTILADWWIREIRSEILRSGMNDLSLGFEKAATISSRSFDEVTNPISALAIFNNTIRGKPRGVRSALTKTFVSTTISFIKFLPAFFDDLFYLALTQGMFSTFLIDRLQERFPAGRKSFSFQFPNQLNFVPFGQLVNQLLYLDHINFKPRHLMFPLFSPHLTLSAAAGQVLNSRAEVRTVNLPPSYAQMDQLSFLEAMLQFEELPKQVDSRIPILNAYDSIHMTGLPETLLTLWPTLPRLGSHKSPQVILEGYAGIEGLRFPNEETQKQFNQIIDSNGLVIQGMFRGPHDPDTTTVRPFVWRDFGIQRMARRLKRLSRRKILEDWIASVEKVFPLSNRDQVTENLRRILLPDSRIEPLNIFYYTSDYGLQRLLEVYIEAMQEAHTRKSGRNYILFTKLNWGKKYRQLDPLDGTYREYRYHDDLLAFLEAKSRSGAINFYDFQDPANPKIPSSESGSLYVINLPTLPSELFDTLRDSSHLAVVAGDMGFRAATSLPKEGVGPDFLFYPHPNNQQNMREDIREALLNPDEITKLKKSSPEEARNREKAFEILDLFLKVQDPNLQYPVSALNRLKERLVQLMTDEDFANEYRDALKYLVPGGGNLFNSYLTLLSKMEEGRQGIPLSTIKKKHLGSIFPPSTSSMDIDPRIKLKFDKHLWMPLLGNFTIGFGDATFLKQLLEVVTAAGAELNNDVAILLTDNDNASLIHGLSSYEQIAAGTSVSMEHLQFLLITQDSQGRPVFHFLKRKDGAKPIAEIMKEILHPGEDSSRPRAEVRTDVQKAQLEIAKIIKGIGPTFPQVGNKMTEATKIIDGGNLVGAGLKIQEAIDLFKKHPSKDSFVGTIRMLEAFRDGLSRAEVQNETKKQIADLKKDKSSQVREEAVKALAAEGEAAVPDLSKALEDADEYVRYGAARALGKMGSKAEAAIPALTKAAEEAKLLTNKEHKIFILKAAIFALGEIGPKVAEYERAVTLLIYYSSHEKKLGKFRKMKHGEVADISAAAIRALNKIGLSRAEVRAIKESVYQDLLRRIQKELGNFAAKEAIEQGIIVPPPNLPPESLRVSKLTLDLGRKAGLLGKREEVKRYRAKVGDVFKEELRLQELMEKPKEMEKELSARLMTAIKLFLEEQFSEGTEKLGQFLWQLGVTDVTVRNILEDHPERIGPREQKALQSVLAAFAIYQLDPREGAWTVFFFEQLLRVLERVKASHSAGPTPEGKDLTIQEILQAAVKMLKGEKSEEDAASVKESKKKVSAMSAEQRRQLRDMVRTILQQLHQSSQPKLTVSNKTIDPIVKALVEIEGSFTATNVAEAFQRGGANLPRPKDIAESLNKAFSRAEVRSVISPIDSATLPNFRRFVFQKGTTYGSTWNWMSKAPYSKFPFNPPFKDYFHTGIDFVKYETTDGRVLPIPGDTPVRAVLAGRVIYQKDQEEVLVKTPNNTLVRYAHIKPLADKGSEVKEGDVIGTFLHYPYGFGMDPHLHLEVMNATVPFEDNELLLDELFPSTRSSDPLLVWPGLVYDAKIDPDDTRIQSEHVENARAEVRVPGKDIPGTIKIRHGSKFEFMTFDDETRVEIGIPGVPLVELRYNPARREYKLSRIEEHVEILKDTFKLGDKIMLGRRYDPHNPSAPRFVDAYVETDLPRDEVNFYGRRFSRFHVEINLSDEPGKVSFKDLLSAFDTEIRITNAQEINWPSDRVDESDITIDRIPEGAESQAIPEVPDIAQSVTDFHDREYTSVSVVDASWGQLRQGNWDDTGIVVHPESLRNRFHRLREPILRFLEGPRIAQDEERAKLVSHLFIYGGILFEKLFSSRTHYYYRRPGPIPLYLFRDAEHIVLMLEGMLNENRVKVHLQGPEGQRVYALVIGNEPPITMLEESAAGHDFAGEVLKQIRRWARDPALTTQQLHRAARVYIEAKRATEEDLTLTHPVAAKFYYDGPEPSLTGDLVPGVIIDFSDITPREAAALKAFLDRAPPADARYLLFGIIFQQDILRFIFWLYTASYLQGELNERTLQGTASTNYSWALGTDRRKIEFRSFVRKVINKLTRDYEFRRTLGFVRDEQYQIKKLDGFIYYQAQDAQRTPANPQAPNFEFPVSLIPEIGTRGLPIVLQTARRRVWFQADLESETGRMTEWKLVSESGRLIHRASVTDPTQRTHFVLNTENPVLISEATFDALPTFAPAAGEEEKEILIEVGPSSYGEMLPAVKVLSRSEPALVGFPLRQNERQRGGAIPAIEEIIPEGELQVSQLFQALAQEQTQLPQLPVNAEGGFRPTVTVDRQAGILTITSLGPEGNPKEDHFKLEANREREFIDRLVRMIAQLNIAGQAAGVVIEPRGENYILITYPTGRIKIQVSKDTLPRIAQILSQALRRSEVRAELTRHSFRELHQLFRGFDFRGFQQKVLEAEDAFLRSGEGWSVARGQAAIAEALFEKNRVEESFELIDQIQNQEVRTQTKAKLGEALLFRRAEMRAGKDLHLVRKIEAVIEKIENASLGGQVRDQILDYLRAALKLAQNNETASLIFKEVNSAKQFYPGGELNFPSINEGREALNNLEYTLKQQMPKPARKFHHFEPSGELRSPYEPSKRLGRPAKVKAVQKTAAPVSKTKTVISKAQQRSHGNIEGLRTWAQAHKGQQADKTLQELAAKFRVGQTTVFKILRANEIKTKFVKPRPEIRSLEIPIKIGETINEVQLEIYEPPTRAEVRKDPRLLEGINERIPDWQRMNLVMHVLMDEQGENPEKLIPLHTVLSKAFNALEGHGLGVPDEYILGLLDRLRNKPIGLIEKHDSSFKLALPIRQLAIKTDHAFYIKAEFENHLAKVNADEEKSEENFINVIKEYSKAIHLWKLYPIEARWPVLRAIAMMNKDKQEVLINFLKKREVEFGNDTLADAMLLMLHSKSFEDWLSRYAPHLIGRNIYYISPETILLAGGLGRVGQFHTFEGKKLLANHAKIKIVEPEYHYKLVDGTEVPIDYTKLATPVLNKKVIMEYEVTVERVAVPVKVSHGTTSDGIDVYLIDGGDYYTRYLYRYSKSHETHQKYATYDQFSEFFSRATLELQHRLEQKKQEQEKDNYKAPILWGNDGQLGTFPVYKRLYDSIDDTLIDAYTQETSHTYNNRGVIESLGTIGLGQEPYNRLFNRISFNDSTSGGIRSADGANTVSAIQRDEVAPFDPHSKLLAITNGDVRSISSVVFRSILKELFPDSDVEHPTAEQIVEVKKLAKRRLNQKIRDKWGWNVDLDSDRMVISYSGRLVEEKAGRKRAFFTRNIRELIKRGAQIVYFGNVQEGTEKMFNELKKLAEEINEQGPGKLIVVTGWNIDDQRDLLAATDLQVQDSDRYIERGTGAAEYTESDASTNGGLQMGPPWIEGIIQRQGIILNRNVEGSGNTLIPIDERPESYLNVFIWALELFDKDHLKFASYQAASVKLSRPLEAIITSAEYFRIFDEGVRKKDNLRQLVRFINKEMPKGRSLSAISESLRRMLNDLTGMRKDEMEKAFGEEKVSAVMYLIAMLVPDLLEKIREWDLATYETLNSMISDLDLVDLFRAGKIKNHSNSNIDVVIISRSIGSKNIIFPIHLGLSTWDEENGKVWVTARDLESLIEDSDERKYQVSDYSLQNKGVTNGEAIVYPAIRKGSQMVQEWKVGIPIRAGVQDDSGYIQHGLHIQALSINEITRAELRAQKPTVGIIGLNRLGYDWAEYYLSLGANVYVYDLAPENPVKKWYRGLKKYPKSRPFSNRKIRFYWDRNGMKKLIRDSDIIHINIGLGEGETAPQFADRLYDIVTQAANALSVLRRSGHDKYKTFVIRSVIPVDFGEAGVPETQRIHNLLSHLTDRFEVVYQPVFLRRDPTIPEVAAEQTILGTLDGKKTRGTNQILSLLDKSESEVSITTARSAELYHFFSGVYQAKKISHANQITELMNQVGGDINAVAFMTALDKRVSLSNMKTGLGYGGWLEVVIQNVIAWLEKRRLHDAQFEKTVFGRLWLMLKEIANINENQIRVFEQLIEKFGPANLSGETIAILGVANRPGSKRVQGSPALKLIEWLVVQKGVGRILIYDPHAEVEFRKWWETRIQSAPSFRTAQFRFVSYEKALSGSKLKLAVIGMAHPEIMRITPQQIAQQLTVNEKFIFDGWNIYGLQPDGTTNHLLLEIKNAGLNYVSMGRKPIGPRFPDSVLLDSRVVKTLSQFPVPEKPSKTVTMIGGGYVGLVTAAEFAELGHKVHIVDVNAERIEKLKRGERVIYEPGLDELLDKHRGKNIFFSTDLESAVRESEFIFIAVGTPSAPDGTINLESIYGAVLDTGKVIQKMKNENNGHISEPPVIVIKSTVTPEAFQISHRLENELDLKLGIHYRLASNPEHLQEGIALSGVQRPDRIALGAHPLMSEIAIHQTWKALLELYRPRIAEIDEAIRRGEKISMPVIVLSDAYSTALEKYVVNAYLAEDITFADLSARIAKFLNAVWSEILEMMRRNPKISQFWFGEPGCGYGGSCFPKDVKALLSYMKRMGFRVNLLDIIVKINDWIKQEAFVKQVVEVVTDRDWDSQIQDKPLEHNHKNFQKNYQIGIWGLAFKANTDDVREAPSLDIIPHLIELGATVIAHDPLDLARKNFESELINQFGSQELQLQRRIIDRRLGLENRALRERKLIKELGERKLRKLIREGKLKIVDDKYEAARGSDALVVLTEWRHYQVQSPTVPEGVDFVRVKEELSSPILIAGRNLRYLPQEMKTRGFKYSSVRHPDVDGRYAQNGMTLPRSEMRAPERKVIVPAKKSIEQPKLSFPRKRESSFRSPTHFRRRTSSSSRKVLRALGASVKTFGDDTKISLQEVTSQVTQKKDMIISLKSLRENRELRSKLEAVLEANRNNDLLEVTIFAHEYESELQAEDLIFGLFQGRNIFTEFKSVQLYTRKRLNLFDQNVTAQSALSRLVEVKRKEVEAKGFSTRVIIIDQQLILSKVMRRDTPKLLARPEALEAALLLFELDGAIDWFKVAGPAGVLDPTRALINFLQQSILNQLKLAVAA